MVQNTQARCRRRASRSVQYRSSFADVHAGLRRALVGPVLQAHHGLPGLQLLLGEISYVLLALAWPVAVRTRVAGLGLSLHNVSNTASGHHRTMTAGHVACHPTVKLKCPLHSHPSTQRVVNFSEHFKGREGDGGGTIKSPLNTPLFTTN